MFFLILGNPDSELVSSSRSYWGKETLVNQGSSIFSQGDKRGPNRRPVDSQ